MSKITFFGLARQYKNLKDELLDSTHNALVHGEWMTGPYTTMFEEWLARRTQRKYAVTVHSGTQALEIMSRYYIEPYRHPSVIGGYFEVEPIMKIPNLTYVATLNAFLSTGWTVELIDTDNNGLIKLTEQDLEQEVASVCFVGLYGANPIYKRGHNTNIVDGAQHWLVANEVGLDMAISFDPTKNLPATGNGGAIVTDDTYLYEYALSYRGNGKFLEHYSTGSNTRMSEQECAQIMVRTKYIDKWQWRRKEIRHYYLDEFRNQKFNCLSRDHMIHADQKFVIYTDQRNELRRYLEDRGIETRIHYDRALSELPIAAKLKKPDMLSTSVMLTRGVLSLPIYPELTDSEVEYIASAVKRFFTC